MRLNESARGKLVAGSAGRFALWVLISLAFLHLPEPPPMDPELDSSWALCLPYMLRHGMQFGADIVFTYGPLGFVISRLYPGSGFWIQAAAMAAAAGMFSWVLIEAVRPMKWPGRIIAILAVLLVISQGRQVIYLLIIALVGPLLLRDGEPWKLKSAVCCVILGFLSLIKFTNFLLAATVVTIAAGRYFLQGKWRHGALIAGGFALALSGWWIVCGQSPSAAAPWISSSLQVSKGYDAMYMDEKPFEKLMGFLLVSLIAAYGLFEAAAAERRVKGCAMVLILWATTYLSWKHSFVRADATHIFGFYFWALGVVVLSAVFFPHRPRWRFARIGLLAAIGLCAVAGIDRLYPKVITSCVPDMMESLHRNFDALINLPRFKRDLDSTYAAVARNNAAPRIVQALGGQSVDVFGYAQAVAIFNGLNYTPRPVFQGYTAYTPKLAALNAGFMAGDRAPEWILERYGSIDHRYPSTDDGLAFRALLDRYTFQFQDSGYAVWRRAQGKDTAVTTLPPPAREGTGMFNRDIPIGDLSANSSLWLEVDYSYTLAGSLRQFLYKPPVVNLLVTSADQPGSPRKFRFPRILAGQGVLLSPYLATDYDFLRYAVGLGGPAVQSFKLKSSRENERYLRRTFHYRLTILPDPANLPANRSFANRIRQYPMFDLVPTGVESAGAPYPVGLDGRAALMVLAPSRIEFSIPAGGHRLAGGFGLKTDAPVADVTGIEKKPAAEFQVLLREGASERVLFDRQLKPSEISADQAFNPWTFLFPRRRPARPSC